MVYFDDSLDFFNDKYLAKEQTKRKATHSENAGYSANYTDP